MWNGIMCGARIIHSSSTLYDRNFLMKPRQHGETGAGLIGCFSVDDSIVWLMGENTGSSKSAETALFDFTVWIHYVTALCRFHYVICIQWLHSSTVYHNFLCTSICTHSGMELVCLFAFSMWFCSCSASRFDIILLFHYFALALYITITTRPNHIYVTSLWGFRSMSHVSQFTVWKMTGLKHGFRTSPQSVVCICSPEQKTSRPDQLQ